METAKHSIRKRDTNYTRKENFEFFFFKENSSKEHNLKNIIVASVKGHGTAQHSIRKRSANYTRK